MKPLKGKETRFVVICMETLESYLSLAPGVTGGSVVYLQR